MSSDSELPRLDFDNFPKTSAEMGNCGEDLTGDESLDLSKLQLRAIGFTVQGLPDTQIADILSINRRTLWDWKTNNEDYRLALASARSQFHDSVIDCSQNLFFRSTTVLAKILEDADVKNRLRAAQILIQNASRMKPPPEKIPTPSPEEDDWPEPNLDPEIDC
jgi:hypothetical protein